jgi:hypothetical protein
MSCSWNNGKKGTANNPIVSQHKSTGRMTTKQERRYKFIVLGAELWGKEWMKALASDDRCEIAGVVARSQSTLNSVSEEFS